MTFVVQVEYGTGEYAHTESTQGFSEMSEAQEFAQKILEEVSGAICKGESADNAIIRIWRDDKPFELINSCTKGCY